MKRKDPIDRWLETEGNTDKFTPAPARYFGTSVELPKPKGQPLYRPVGQKDK